MKKIPKSTVIPREDHTRSLLAAAKAGDRKAADKLVRESMPLVEAVVSKQHRPDIHDDLVQAGLCGSSEGQANGAKAGGLMRAIELWDPERTASGKPIRWATFATWWIRAGVQAELYKQGPLIGPNRRTLKRRAKVRKAAAALEAKMGKRPTTAEIRDSLKVPEHPGIIEAAMKPLIKQMATTDRDGDGRRVWEELRSGATPTPEQALDLQRMIQRIRDAVSDLPPIERLVVAGTFGIESREMTQEDLAKLAGLSERVLRQVKAKALARLQKRLVDLETGRTRGEDLEDPVGTGETRTFGELEGYRSGPSREQIDQCAQGQGAISLRHGRPLS